MNHANKAKNHRSETDRVFGLDVMRSCAILLVLLSHVLLLLRYRYHTAGWALMSGTFGVELFFVLSGFLIGGILLRDFEQSQSAFVIRDFWIRRWFRTLPNYYLFLIINIGLSLTFSKLPSDLWKYPFFLQNWSMPLTSAFFTESWSLAIEEWFYIFTPIFIFVGLKTMGCKLKQASLCTIVVVLAATNIARLYYVISPANDVLNNPGGIVLLRLDACMFGVLAAWIKHFNPDMWSKRPRTCFSLGICLLIAAALMFMFLSRQTSIQLRTNFYTVLSLGAMCLLPALDLQKKSGALSTAVFSRISIWSYSAYLINFPVFLLTNYFLKQHIRSNATVAFFCAMACVIITLLLAGLNYHFFEKRITRLRDRLTRAKSANIAITS